MDIIEKSRPREVFLNFSDNKTIVVERERSLAGLYIGQ